ncbi:hypothetical protein Krac_3836 [Ktedonobacter racemifer DSM 44963]|uniref:Uncharacterized protein n=1 Tax=Ktedonobacter racemifer DSM 44963 TaxID=485913 RepID=D6U336_KTERA|nr:hypothetical protein Krac_3836 [Ktedonobacter racemifer DSM 44963]
MIDVMEPETSPSLGMPIQETFQWMVTQAQISSEYAKQYSHHLLMQSHEISVKRSWMTHFHRTEKRSRDESYVPERK